MQLEVLPATLPTSAPSSPAPWVRGLAILPFGLVLGFMWTALPFLLTRQGVSLARVAGISATVLLPTVWAFLVKPVLDSGLTRRAWCWLFAAIASLSVCIGVSALTPAHLAIAVPALWLAVLSMVLYAGAANGWISQVTADSQRGAVAGWANLFLLGGGALGSFAIMVLLARNILSQSGAGLLMGGMVWVGAAALLFFPAPAEPRFPLTQAYSTALIALWKTVRRRQSLLGFALLLSPAAGTAAGVLVSGLGRDFHASEATVIWVTGIGQALAISLGALAGGRLADRFPRAYVYLFAGLFSAATAIATALLPHTAMVFIVSTLTYSAIVGAIFAAYNALALQLTGSSPVAATQLGLFAAAINLNVNYMTRADGFGYRLSGVRGLFLTDGLASLLFLLPLLWVVHVQSRAPAVEK
jgi:MFS family permease